MHTTRAEAERVAAGTDVTVAHRPVDPLLRLQALAGNDAVRRLVAPAPVPRAPARVRPVATVQRMRGRRHAAHVAGLGYNGDATREKEGPCGGFVRVRRWVVPPRFTGLIIQQVTREFDVHEVKTGKPLAGAALDDYIRGGTSSVNATETTYWEAWTVSNGVVSDGGEDTFQSCSFIPGGRGRQLLDTTWGSYRITGGATLYRCGSPAARAGRLGFTRAGPAMAGGLLSRTSAPDTCGLDRVGGELVYWVNVTWDSRRKDLYYSTVTVGPPRRRFLSYGLWALMGAAAVAAAYAYGAFG